MGNRGFSVNKYTSMLLKKTLRNSNLVVLSINNNCLTLTESKTRPRYAVSSIGGGDGDGVNTVLVCD